MSSSNNKVVPFDGDSTTTTLDSSEKKSESSSISSLNDSDTGKTVKMSKVEKLLAKKNNIKALNSFNDTTGKRLRILRAQVSHYHYYTNNTQRLRLTTTTHYYRYRDPS